MSATRLYCPNLTQGPNELSESESHHAIASLRIRPGDEVTLFDGAGREAIGRVLHTGRRKLQVEVMAIAEYPHDTPRRLTLAVAMPKANRQGYLIEKCTELGVAAIWPVVTDRSVTRPRRRAVEKWYARAVEAAKQSNRRWVPRIADPMSFTESIERVGQLDAVGMADLDSSAGSIVDLMARVPEGGAVGIWIGPEGGWTQKEREFARRAGAESVSLGPTVLRTETAAVAVCAVAAAT